MVKTVSSPTTTPTPPSSIKPKKFGKKRLRRLQLKEQEFYLNLPKGVKVVDPSGSILTNQVDQREDETHEDQRTIRIGCFEVDIE